MAQKEGNMEKANEHFKKANEYKARYDKLRAERIEITNDYRNNGVKPEPVKDSVEFKARVVTPERIQSLSEYKNIPSDLPAGEKLAILANYLTEYKVAIQQSQIYNSNNPKVTSDLVAAYNDCLAARYEVFEKTKNKDINSPEYELKASQKYNYPHYEDKQNSKSGKKKLHIKNPENINKTFSGFSKKGLEEFNASLNSNETKQETLKPMLDITAKQYKNKINNEKENDTIAVSNEPVSTKIENLNKFNGDSLKAFISNNQSKINVQEPKQETIKPMLDITAKQYKNKINNKKENDTVVVSNEPLSTKIENLNKFNGNSLKAFISNNQSKINVQEPKQEMIKPMLDITAKQYKNKINNKKENDTIVVSNEPVSTKTTNINSFNKKAFEAFKANNQLKDSAQKSKSRDDDDGER